MEAIELYPALELVVKLPKGVIMSEATFKATMEVAPATGTALTLTPTSADFPDLQVGVAADGTAVTTVSGGVPPYEYSMDPDSDPLPAGITFEEDETGTIVTLAGTPTAAGDYGTTNGILLDVTDSAGAQAKFKARKIVGSVVAKK
jgi:hypothetical protein